MSALRNFARSCAVFALGRERKPRTILRGLASGYRICVSPAEHLAYLVGTAEPHLQRLIREYVRAGDTVYDVGANMGYVTLSLAKRVGPGGRVVAFEPVPQSLDLLRSNIADNRLANVQVFDAAASDRTGEAVIRIAENLATASLVWHKHEQSVHETVIRTVAIDELIDAGKIPRPKFVKIDVEGAEALVLQGMRRTLAAARPVLFVECSDVGREMAWQILSELGYRCETAIAREPVNDVEHYRDIEFLWLPTSPAGS